MNKAAMADAFKMGAGFTSENNKQLLLLLLLLMLLFWFMYYMLGVYKDYKKHKAAEKFYSSVWVSVAVLTVLIGLYSVN